MIFHTHPFWNYSSTHASLAHSIATVGSAANSLGKLKIEQNSTIMSRLKFWFNSSHPLLAIPTLQSPPSPLLTAAAFWKHLPLVEQFLSFSSVASALKSSMRSEECRHSHSDLAFHNLI